MEHRKDQQGFDGFKRLSAFFHDSGHVTHYSGGQGKSNFMRRFGSTLLVAAFMSTIPLAPVVADNMRNLINKDVLQEIIDAANLRLTQAGNVAANILIVPPGSPVEVMKDDICPAVPLPADMNRWDATRALTGVDHDIRISYLAGDIHRFAADHAAGSCIADELIVQNPDAKWDREQFATVYAALNQIATGAPDVMVRELSKFYIETEANTPYPDRLKSPGLDIVAKDLRKLKRELAGAGTEQVIAAALEILPRQQATIEARFEKQFEQLRQTFDRLAGIYTDMDVQDIEAIRRAANDSEVDFAELMTKIAIESAFDENAEAAKSSATGLGQHIDQTWLAAVYIYGNRFGMDDAVKDITRRKTKSGYVYSVKDDAREAEILGLRNDRYYSAVLTGALMKENDALLRHRLRRQTNATDRYIAHMMGPNDAVTLIRAAQQGDPRAARDLFPAQNNPAVYNPRFFKRGSTYLTAPTVYDNIEKFFNGRLRQFKTFENSPVSDRDLFSLTQAPIRPKPRPG